MMNRVPSEFVASRAVRKRAAVEAEMLLASNALACYRADLLASPSGVGGRGATELVANTTEAAVSSVPLRQAAGNTPDTGASFRSAAAATAAAAAKSSSIGAAPPPDRSSVSLGCGPAMASPAAAALALRNHRAQQLLLRQRLGVRPERPPLVDPALLAHRRLAEARGIGAANLCAGVRLGAAPEGVLATQQPPLSGNLAGRPALAAAYNANIGVMTSAAGIRRDAGGVFANTAATTGPPLFGACRSGAFADGFIDAETLNRRSAVQALLMASRTSSSLSGSGGERDGEKDLVPAATPLPPLPGLTTQPGQRSLHSQNMAAAPPASDMTSPRVYPKATARLELADESSAPPLTCSPEKKKPRVDLGGRRDEKEGEKTEEERKAPVGVAARAGTTGGGGAGGIPLPSGRGARSLDEAAALAAVGHLASKRRRLLMAAASSALPNDVQQAGQQSTAAGARAPPRHAISSRSVGLTGVPSEGDKAGAGGCWAAMPDWRESKEHHQSRRTMAALIERRIRQLILPDESVTTASHLDNKSGGAGANAPAADTDSTPSAPTAALQLRRPAFLAKALENRLYRMAPSYESYLDTSTLEGRLRSLCLVLGGRIGRLQREQREQEEADAGGVSKEEDRWETAKGGTAEQPRKRRGAAAALKAALGSKLYCNAAELVLSVRALRAKHANDPSILVVGRTGEKRDGEDRCESFDSGVPSDDSNPKSSSPPNKTEDSERKNRSNCNDGTVPDYRDEPTPDPETVSPARVVLWSPAAGLYFDPDLCSLVNDWDRHHRRLVTGSNLEASASAWLAMMNHAQAIVSKFQHIISEGTVEVSEDHRN